MNKENKVLNNIRTNILDSIVKLIHTMKPLSKISTNSSRNKLSSIYVDNELILDIEDYLVLQYYSKLDLDTEQRIALAKLSDSLQYIESLLFKETI